MNYNKQISIKQKIIKKTHKKKKNFKKTKRNTNLKLCVY